MTNNIVQFPKSAIIRDTTAHNIERLEAVKERGVQNFAEVLISEISEDIMMGIGSCGIDIENEVFMKDFLVLHAVLQGLIYRSLELKHDMQKYIDETATVITVDPNAPEELELPLELPPGSTS